MLARLFATNVQSALSLVAAVATLTLALANPLSDRTLWPFLFVQLVLILLWLRGVTAWARVDDAGLHWRYWIGSEHSWGDVRTVTLTRRANPMSQAAAGVPIILVRGKDGDEDFIAPARGCGRRRREFASEVLAAARANGVATEVVATGWNEEPTRVAEPWA